VKLTVLETVLSCFLCQLCLQQCKVRIADFSPVRGNEGVVKIESVRSGSSRPAGLLFYQQLLIKNTTHKNLKKGKMGAEHSLAASRFRNIS
jgi:hypothetical protein